MISYWGIVTGGRYSPNTRRAQVAQYLKKSTVAHNMFHKHDSTSSVFEAPILRAYGVYMLFETAHSSRIWFLHAF